jgi:hypothetical protein
MSLGPKRISGVRSGPDRDLGGLEGLKDLKEREEGLLVDLFIESVPEFGRVAYLIEQAFPSVEMEGPANPDGEVGLEDPPSPWMEVLLEMEDPRGVPFGLEGVLPRVELRRAVPGSRKLQDAHELAVRMDEGVIGAPLGGCYPPHHLRPTPFAHFM